MSGSLHLSSAQIRPEQALLNAVATARENATPDSLTPRASLSHPPDSNTGNAFDDHRHFLTSLHKTRQNE